MKYIIIIFIFGSFLFSQDKALRPGNIDNSPRVEQVNGNDQQIIGKPDSNIKLDNTQQPGNKE